jgi:deazaflavin-dependent oxidoreductase (nitroreductase family)
MDSSTRAALDRGGVVDITTTGRKSGKPRRIEINFQQLEGRFYITGRPGVPRDWLANLHANPTFTVHLKDEVAANVTAVARPVTDPGERETVLYRILTESWDTDPDRARSPVPRWVAGSSLVEFELA